MGHHSLNAESLEITSTAVPLMGINTYLSQHSGIQSLQVHWPGHTCSYQNPQGKPTKQILILFNAMSAP